MSENKQKSTLIKDALILFAITLIAAIALGAVYEITKDPIAEAEAKAKTDAAKAVYPDMNETKEPEAAVLDAANALISADSAIDSVTIDEILFALDGNGNKVGEILTVTSKKGYGGAVTAMMGVSDDGTLKGIEFLSISETPGLGMKAKDDAFKNQFKDVNTDSFSLEKRNIKGSTPIDAISSATITTTAVTNMLNAGLKAAASID